MIVNKKLFLLTLFSGLVISPKATEIKKRIREVVDDDVKKGVLRDKFRKLHGMSALLNLSVTIVGLVVVFLTARNL